MDRSRYTDLFVSESREHVSAINHHLLALEADAQDPVAVEETFRAVHTLKGMSAAMGFTRSAALAHALEHTLEQLRSGALGSDREITNTLFEAVDALERSIEVEVAAAAGESGVEDGVGPAGPGRAEQQEGQLNGRPVRVTVMIGANAPLPAVRAILALRRARELGVVSGAEPDEERLSAGEFSGTLRFDLRTDREQDEIRASLMSAGEVAHVLLEEIEEAGEGEAEGEGTGDGGARAGSGRSPARGPVVRVGQERLDLLIDQVGELVVARDGLQRLALLREDEELSESAERISRLIADLRDEVMHLRMVPVGEVFERFPRLVRDAARSLGKKVGFRMSGRDVQLDRSLLNELGDLLVHLLRNAVDHGVETPEERIEAGKPEEGEVRLSATRERSQVVVRVEDDGRGIQRERVVRAAIERGWLRAAEAEGLPDAELLAFLTRPGFSTADRVTDVSGRGVGLDVVATRLRALGGAMEVRSEPGTATAFTLRLPLSLAIVRCLQVEIAAALYLIPLSRIREVTEFDDSAVLPGEPWEQIRLRDETIPLLRLDSLLAATPTRPDFGLRPAVVVEGGGSPLAFAVDALIGQHESVLKPFDSPAEMLPFFSGGALLSDGRPALVLDVRRIAAWAADRARAGEITTTTGVPC